MAINHNIMKKFLLSVICTMVGVSAFAVTFDDLCTTYVARRSCTEYYVLTGGSNWAVINDTYLVVAEKATDVNNPYAIRFKYFLNYESLTGKTTDYEELVGIADMEAKTITFEEQRLGPSSKYTFRKEDGTTPFVATFDDDGVITLDGWTVWTGSYAGIVYAQMSLTPGPSVSLLCGNKTMTMNVLDGTDANGVKYLTQWDADSISITMPVEAAGDNAICITAFDGMFDAPVTGTVDWSTLTVTVPPTGVQGMYVCGTGGLDFSGDVVRDADGNEVSATMSFMDSIRPMIIRIRPDMVMEYEGCICMNWSEINDAPYTGISTMVYFNGDITDAIVDLSAYCGTYHNAEFDGSDAGALDLKHTNWTDFDYADQWDINVTQEGNLLKFECALVNPTSTYAYCDFLYGSVDEEAGTVTFPLDNNRGGVIGAYTLFPYVDGSIVTDTDLVATLAPETGAITMPPYVIHYIGYNATYCYVYNHVIARGASGIESVGADSDVNAPVEYYNLQGIRIAQPTPGTVVIRRQGSTATKLLVK